VSYWLRSAETLDPFDIESFFKSAPAKQHTSLAAYEQTRIGKGTNRNQKASIALAISLRLDFF
jgi:hypothetical protein